MLIRLTIVAILAALAVYAIRLWMQYRPVDQKAQELEDVEVETQVVGIDEQIVEKREDIRRRREKLATTQ